MSDKIEKIKEIVGSEFHFQVEEKSDGSVLMVGPFPSFIVLLNNGNQSDGFIVSVNADAPNVVYILSEILKAFPDMQHYGPYAELPDSGEIVFGEEAYMAREDHLLARGMEIASRRAQEVEAKKSELYVPEQKQLIIPGV